jgi:PAS domain-containing protein
MTYHRHPMSEELRPPDAAVLADLLDRMPAAAGLWDPSLRSLWTRLALARWFGGEPAEFRGRPAASSGVAIDDTDPHAAESEQRALAGQQRLPSEWTPALRRSIGREGRLLAASDRWVEKISWPRAELVGRPISERCTGESRRLALQRGPPAL